MPKNFKLPAPSLEHLGKTFWTITHTLMRHGDEDVERAGKAIASVRPHLAVVREIASNEQEQILCRIYKAHKEGKVAPSWPAIRDEIADTPSLKLFIDEYESLAKDLPILPDLDLPAIIQKWKVSWKKHQARNVLALAQEILVGKKRVEDHNGDVIVLHGPEAALDLVTEVRDELFREGMSTSSSVVIGDPKSKSIIMDETLGRNPRRVIPTGLPALDEVLTLCPGHLVGILAGPGVGKTRFSRSLVYNMATRGFKVLHVQLETHETSEVNYYSLIHACSRDDWASHARYLGLTFNKLHRGEASPESTTWLTEVVLKDFEESLQGSVTILSPKDQTWGTIREEIDHLAEVESPFDVVLIDYLTLVQSGSSRDKDSRVMEAIANATRWAQETSTLVLSPIQGRRDAAAKAKDEDDGIWDLSGIYKYSDYDRHLTACISLTVMDNEDVHLSIPKNRWGAQIWRPVVCRANHTCGYIYQPNAQTQGQDREPTFDDLL